MLQPRESSNPNQQMKNKYSTSTTARNQKYKKSQLGANHHAAGHATSASSQQKINLVAGTATYATGSKKGAPHRGHGNSQTYAH